MIRLKRLGSFITAVLLAGMLSLPAAAAETAVPAAGVTPASSATFAFDNSVGASLWATDNPELDKATGFKLAVSDAQVYSGAGSLAVNESLTGSVDKEMTGSAFITVDKLGLTNLAGCTVTAKVYPLRYALDIGAQITLYTDGMLYLPMALSNLTADSWNNVSMTAPENCNNTRIGLLVPLYSTYNGAVFYIDDLTITKPDGTIIANVGDAEAPTEKQADGPISTTRAVIITIVAIAVAIGAGVVVIIALYHRSKRYR